MGGYQSFGSTSDQSLWCDLGTGQTFRTPNIGSDVLVVPGDHVIGRLVPVRDGSLFESPPLVVPAGVAREVAQRPAEWCDVLEAARAESGRLPFTTTMSHRPLACDVPTLVWQMALVDEHRMPAGDDVDALAAAQVRSVLDTAERELRLEDDERPDWAVDVWPCLGAALLTPWVVETLATMAQPSDAETLRGLAARLAEPAASVCLDLAATILRAA